ncbi:MAG: alpha-amylase family glycosyl hydrolase, partial [Anaerolineae bacterium]
AGDWTDARARVAAALLLTLRGTPFLYYGEEIGMREVPIPREEIQDPPGRRFWPFYKGRDGCRTPMQWDGSEHAGFTRGIPWIRVGPDYRERNVAAQEGDPGSLLNFYRRLIWLRKATPALQRGAYRALLHRPTRALAYLRETPEQAVLVFLNLSARPARLTLEEPLPSRDWKVLLDTAGWGERVRLAGPVTLPPYAVCLLEAG